jgi:hypothetical protein
MLAPQVTLLNDIAAILALVPPGPVEPATLHVIETEYWPPHISIRSTPVIAPALVKRLRDDPVRARACGLDNVTCFNIAICGVSGLWPFMS